MNAYTFQDIEIGMQAEFSVPVTEQMMKDFLACSGDENPLHNDAKFAKEQGFPERVAYGMLTASLYSRLAGCYLPGKYCLLQSVHADFLQPVYVEDVLRVIGKVVNKSDAVKQMVVKAEIRNQKDKKVSKAKIEMGVLR